MRAEQFVSLFFFRNTCRFARLHVSSSLAQSLDDLHLNSYLAEELRALVAIFAGKLRRSFTQIEDKIENAPFGWCFLWLKSYNLDAIF